MTKLEAALCLQCFCRCSLARDRVHTMGQEAYADFVRKLEETGLQLIAVRAPRLPLLLCVFSCSGVPSRLPAVLACLTG